MARREEWVKGKKRNFENDISSIISNVIKPSLDKYSKIEAELILNWNKIFNDFSKKIQLNKVVFVDKKNNRFHLHVFCTNQDYLEVTYSTELIKERVNIHLGYTGAQKISVIKR